jgi:RNA polymerase sigma-70 factor (ECF subfamily)
MARRAPAVEASRGPADERLLIEAAQRDSRRFADLYEQNFERVYAFVARRVRDRDEAEDITADVFHRALRNLVQFQWRGAPFAAWLLRIAANAIIDRAARDQRERVLPPPDDPPPLDLDETERRARLFRLVNGLPADQRRVIVMRFGEQKTAREIARDLERTEGAVKQLQFRALKNLRAQLSESDG